MIQKQYYTIGEVAQKLGVTAMCVRFWEGHFPFTRPARIRNGRRKYSFLELRKLEELNIIIKKLGFTLEGAKKVYEYKQKSIVLEIYESRCRKDKQCSILDAAL